MTHDEPPLIALPANLPDETAAALLEFLYELVTSLEHHYAEHIHRHYDHLPDEPPDDDPLDIGNDEDDIPF